MILVTSSMYRSKHIYVQRTICIHCFWEFQKCYFIKPLNHHSLQNVKEVNLGMHSQTLISIFVCSNTPLQYMTRAVYYGFRLLHGRASWVAIQGGWRDISPHGIGWGIYCTLYHPPWNQPADSEIMSKS